MVTHFVDAVEGEHGAALHGKLRHAQQPGAQKVLAQQHTEHGRLRRILRGIFRQVQPGSRGVGGEEQLLPPLPAAQVQDQGVPAGLVNLVHPGPQAPFPDLPQHRSHKISIKGHKILLRSN